MSFLSDIGKRLVTLRKKHNLKQKEAAELIGISSVNLSRYENGKRTPDTEMVNKLASFYNVDPSYILFGKEKDAHEFLKDITDEEAELLKEYLAEIRKGKK